MCIPLIDHVYILSSLAGLLHMLKSAMRLSSAMVSPSQGLSSES